MKCIDDLVAEIVAILRKNSVNITDYNDRYGRDACFIHASSKTAQLTIQIDYGLDRISLKSFNDDEVYLIVYNFSEINPAFTVETIIQKFLNELLTD